MDDDDEQHPARILVRSTRKPASYINTAKRFLQEHGEVQLSGLGTAIAPMVAAAEILKSRGLAVEKKIYTSLAHLQGEEDGSRKTRDKPKMEITLAKSERFDAIVAAEAEATAMGLHSLDNGAGTLDETYLDDVGDFSSGDFAFVWAGQQLTSGQDRGPSTQTLLSSSVFQPQWEPRREAGGSSQQSAGRQHGLPPLRFPYSDSAQRGPGQNLLPDGVGSSGGLSRNLREGMRVASESPSKMLGADFQRLQVGQLGRGAAPVFGGPRIFQDQSPRANNFVRGRGSFQPSSSAGDGLGSGRLDGFAAAPPPPYGQGFSSRREGWNLQGRGTRQQLPLSGYLGTGSQQRGSSSQPAQPAAPFSYAAYLHDPMRDPYQQLQGSSHSARSSTPPGPFQATFSPQEPQREPSMRLSPRESGMRPTPGPFQASFSPQEPQQEPSMRLSPSNFQATFSPQEPQQEPGMRSPLGPFQANFPAPESQQEPGMRRFVEVGDMQAGMPSWLQGYAGNFGGSRDMGDAGTSSLVTQLDALGQLNLGEDRSSPQMPP